MAKPLLAIVAGRPGSGKSTLASQLAEELRIPLVSRDRLKEGLLRTSGLETADHQKAAQTVYDLFFQTIEALVRHEVSLVAEAAFQHELWAPRLIPLLDEADVRMVLCQAPPEVAAERRRQRERRDPLWARYHPSPEDQGFEEYDPPRIEAPTRFVDTTQPLDLPGLRQFLD